ncbi:hypothetical protein TRICI_001504 [Trichomonascus ciferrii]|uniref:Triacylglycerol lipase n=1 Tax=Trichomonascus ciferrii TaxID=44093 RepID=A0A642V972_9ASCO|nr:hypothetical protein TRICI_001504 [Trichomonascus ciferrii]
MCRRLYLFLILLIVGAFAQEAGSYKPARDGFYRTPENITDYSPGEIINSRKLRYVLAIPNLDSQYQVLYRTTDSYGNAIAAVTTVLIPDHVRRDRIVSYQYVINSASLNCSPSYELALGSYTVTMHNLVQRKWIVSIPDYFGIEAAFGANVMSGQAILDSIRAIKSYKEFGVPNSASTCLWGTATASGVTAFAAELQPTYAPDVHLAGAIMLDLVANMTEYMLQRNSDFGSEVIPPWIMGLSREYPDIRDKTIDELNPSDESSFMKVKENCQYENNMEFADEDILSQWKLGADVFSDKKVSRIMDNLTCGGHGLAPPSRIYANVDDPKVLVGPIERAVTQYCNHRSTLKFIKMKDLKLAWIFDKLPSDDRRWDATYKFTLEPLDWIDDRFDGKSVNRECITTTSYQRSRATATASTSAPTSTSAGTATMNQSPQVLLFTGLFIVFLR